MSTFDSQFSYLACATILQVISCVRNLSIETHYTVQLNIVLDKIHIERCMVILVESVQNWLQKPER